MTSFDLTLGGFDPESEELVRRLRSLDWPAVRPEVRERCWAAFSERLTAREHEDDKPLQAGNLGRRNAARRLDFTRVSPAGKSPYVRSAAAPRSWARPQRGFAAFVA